MTDEFIMQFPKLRETFNGRTCDDEERILEATFGRPNEHGFYGVPDPDAEARWEGEGGSAQ